MVWTSDDPAGRLYWWLRVEYQTRPPFNDWEAHGDQQIQAVVRLLYYFPRRGVPLVADHLARLNVASPDNTEEGRQKRDAANGIRTVEFIWAATWWRKEPAIRKALRGILKRTTDPDIRLEILSAVPEGTPEPADRR
jgi:hypothetical protein